MSQHYGVPPPNQYGASAQNLQFFPSSYSPGVPPPGTPSQAGYGYGSPPASSRYGGFGGAGAASISGRMGEQGGLRTGWLAAFSTEGYENEPPLLEELGVNFAHIKAKTLAVLNPFARIDRHIMDDSDLAGPLLFFFLFGTFLLFSGKVHFGYIYGLGLMGTIVLHSILSLMTPDSTSDSVGSDHASPAAHLAPGYSTAGYPGADDRGGAAGGGLAAMTSPLTFPRSASVLGYCLLPLVLTSLLGIVMPLDGVTGYLLTTLAICWSTLSSSGMFCVIGRMKSMRGLVAYPVALFYVGFGIMSIFSSRGSGTLGKVAGLA